MPSFPSDALEEGHPDGGGSRSLCVRFANCVVDETVTFPLDESGGRVAVSVLGLIRSSPSLRVLHVSEEVEGQADSAFRRYASLRVSYTDCTTQILMQRERIDTAFSFDRDLETLGFQRIP